MVIAPAQLVPRDGRRADNFRRSGRHLVEQQVELLLKISVKLAARRALEQPGPDPRVELLSVLVTQPRRAPRHLRPVVALVDVVDELAAVFKTPVLAKLGADVQKITLVPPGARVDRVVGRANVGDGGFKRQQELLQLSRTPLGKRGEKGFPTVAKQPVLAAAVPPARVEQPLGADVEPPARFYPRARAEEVVVADEALAGGERRDEQITLASEEERVLAGELGKVVVVDVEGPGGLGEGLGAGVVDVEGDDDDEVFVVFEEGEVRGEDTAGHGAGERLR